MDNDNQSNAFADAGKDVQQGNIFSEFISFLAHNKKWWLLPIIIVMVLFGAVLALSSTAAAPFIYTLF